MVPYQPQILYVQPVQPQFIRQTVQPSSSSIRTVSDIESFMENQRMNQLPAFKPYTYGATQNSAPIFCANKDEWNFLVKAIYVPQQLTLSTPIPQATPTGVLSAAPIPSSNEHIEHLISFFDEQPEDVTPKPVSSDVISYLTKKFTKENDNFNQDEYRKRCRQAEFPYPKSCLLYTSDAADE